MKVTKEVTFDAAHMLSGYSGLCRNLHGHTYKLQFSFEWKDGGVQEQNGENDSDVGMVLDFRKLNASLEEVARVYDHSIIFSGSDFRKDQEDALLNWAEEFDMDFVCLEGRSTCEGILDDILDRMEQELEASGLDRMRGQAIVISGRLWETPTSFCEEIRRW